MRSEAPDSMPSDSSAPAAPQRGRAAHMRASALMAAGSTVSRILGFVRNFLLGMVLGGTSTVAANSFSAANILPSSLWLLIGGGTLNAILVPAIVRAMKRPDGGDDYMSRLTTLILVVTGAATALAMLLVTPLLVVANSNLDPVTMQAATTLAYFLLPQMLLSALYVMFGQVLNAHESFGPFQWAPALNNIMAILSSIAFLVLFGSQPDPTAWTMPMVLMLAGIQVSGSVVQSAFLWYWTHRIGLRIRLKWGFRNLGLRTLGKLGMWTLAMVILGQIGVFATRWASGPTVDAISRLHQEGRTAEAQKYAGLAALDWSYTVFMVPQGIIAVALVTSVFTQISRHARDGDHQGAFETYAETGRILMVPMILFSVLFGVLAGPIMWVAIGGTTPTSAEANGLVLAAYMVGLLPFASLYLTKRFFYAYEDARMSFLTQIPVTAFSLAMIIPISRLVDPQFATPAAALVTSIGNLMAWGMGTWMLRRKLQRLGVRPHGLGLTISTFLRLLVAAVVSGAAGWGLLHAAHDWVWSSRPVAVLVCGAIGAVMAALFIGAAFVLRVEEIRAMGAFVGRRLKRSR
ncbi:lipid II flippase MurJ [Helcobacillus massiliensis]